MGDYDNLDSAALRELCKGRELASYGNKAALRARLEQADVPPVEGVTPGWWESAIAQYEGLPLDSIGETSAPTGPSLPGVAITVAAPAESAAPVDTRPREPGPAPEDPNLPRLVSPTVFQIGYVLGDSFDDDQHAALLGETAMQAAVAGHHVKGGARLVSLTRNEDGTQTARYEVLVRRSP